MQKHIHIPIVHPPMKCIVMVGGLQCHTFHGPFDTQEEAREWATTNELVGEQNWEILPLRPVY